MTVCPHSGKYRHADRLAAHRHLAGLKRRKRRYPGEVYRCRWCDGWHVGSSRKNLPRRLSG